LRYDVIVVGFRLNASLKPAQALQMVLGLDADTSKELTRRFPASVLSGVSLSRAERVSQELTDAGAKVEVRESRISLTQQAALDGGPAPAERGEPESGNYEIGEILAPLGRGALSQPAPAQAAASGAKRPSREELDQALRDSFRPESAGAGATVQTRAAPAAADKLELMDNSAFAGLQSFGDGLDGFELAAPKLAVDEVALRSIQRRPDPAELEISGAPSPPARVARWLSHVAGLAFEWGVALLGLLVVVGITLAAVGYALNPADVLGALGLGPLSASVRQLLTTLSGN
jgi:hypothetical protein